MDVANQVASGLARAHEHGIVLRDIKPAYINPTKDGDAKIVDFGLAKLSGSERPDANRVNPWDRGLYVPRAAAG